MTNKIINKKDFSKKVVPPPEASSGRGGPTLAKGDDMKQKKVDWGKDRN